MHNSADPDQMRQNAASDQGLQGLLIESSIDLYETSVLFVGCRQTVQTQIRRRRTRRLISVSTVLLTGNAIRILIKIQKYN